MAITVRELITKLTIGGNASDKLAKFGLAVNGVKAGLDIMVGAVKVASAATLGLVDDVTTLGDTIAKTSREVGVSAKSFQRLSFAAERSGVPIGNLKKGLQNIARNLRDAEIAAGKGQGTGFTRALADVGIKLKDLSNLNAEEKIGLIGEALSQVSDEGERVALSQRLVGEAAGPIFASLLAEGTVGIKALGDEAERLGLVMGDDALNASEAFQDSMTNVKSVMMGVKTTVAVSLIPAVKKAVDKFRDWLLVNKDFVTSRIEKVVEFLAGAFDMLLDNIDGIIKGFTSMVRVGRDVVGFLINMTELVGGLENALRLAAAGWVTFRVAAMAATAGLSLTPLGLLAIAVGAVALAFAKVETNADKARAARAKFEAGAFETDKAPDQRTVDQDAASIAKSVRAGTKLSPFVRRRLERESSRQALATFRAARGLLNSGVRSVKAGREAGRRRQFGKSGLTAVRPKKVIGAGAGEIDLLDEFKIQIGETRRLERIGREERAAEAITSGASGGGGGVAGPGFTPFAENLGKQKDSGESLSDLVAGAIKSGKLPEAAALLASSQPPIIIPITNQTFAIQVDATSTIEGISGENAADLNERVGDIFEERMNMVMRTTMDQFSPQLAR